MAVLPRVLCIDDEVNILESLKRTLNDDFDVVTADNAQQALALIEKNEFAVIMCDMRMPHMDGAEFFSLARQMAPDSTRILLTGHADLDSALSVINDGNIFRFLLKPCHEDKLIKNIHEGVHLYTLIKSEKDLLEKTLKGAIRVLIETLSIISPDAFSRAKHIMKYVSHMAKEADFSELWQFEVAAMLSQMGAIILPPDMLRKVFGELPLDAEEEAMLATIPKVGAKIVSEIPRLENVAGMIEAQVYSDDQLLNLSSPKVIVGARMLRIANSLDKLLLREKISLKKALEELSKSYAAGEDKELLSHLLSFKQALSNRILKSLNVLELRPGMVLDEDVYTNSGSIVLAKDQELNTALIARLVNFSKRTGIQEPIQIVDKSP